MNAEEIKMIIQVMADSGLATMELEDDQFVLKLSRYAAPAPQREMIPSAPLAPELSVPEAATQQPDPMKTASELQEAVADERLFFVESPIVGTFYESGAPGEPAFVSKGDRVSKGQVICIIEAMKLMNEIKSEVDGTVEEILVDNEQMVEFGHRLMAIRPEGA